MLWQPRCKHFTSILDHTCKAGVVYESVRDVDVIVGSRGLPEFINRYPCVQANARTTCAQLEPPAEG